MQRFGIKTAAMVLAVALLAGGCGQAKMSQRPLSGAATPPASPSASPLPSATPGNVPQSTPAPQLKQLTIQAFYADSDEMKLVQQNVTISYKTEADKYLAALDALKTSADKKLISLSSGITYHSAVVKDGNAVIDLSLGKNGQLGAPGEELFLQSIEKTLFQFQELKTIDILLDGKRVDSLMGHMDLPHPIKRT